MAIGIRQTATAVGPRVTASFLGNGGTAPYLYSVATGGPGGTIDPSSGLYTAPVMVSQDPRRRYDTIIVTDYVGQTASSQIMVGAPFHLFCEIIQRGMNLAPERVYLWDQKINQPTDSALFISVTVGTQKPFSNNNRFVPTSGLDENQYTNFSAQMHVDIKSRSTDALYRKEEVVLALGSMYAENQQLRNSFNISRLPSPGQFINLNDVDGAAIPYRYRISFYMQYCYAKVAPVDYFDEFPTTSVTTES